MDKGKIDRDRADLRRQIAAAWALFLSRRLGSSTIRWRGAARKLALEAEDVGRRFVAEVLER